MGKKWNTGKYSLDGVGENIFNFYFFFKFSGTQFLQEKAICSNTEKLLFHTLP